VNLPTVAVKEQSADGTEFSDISDEDMREMVDTSDEEESVYDEWQGEPDGGTEPSPQLRADVGRGPALQIRRTDVGGIPAGPTLQSKQTACHRDQDFEVINDNAEYTYFEIIDDNPEVMDWISLFEHDNDDLMPMMDENHDGVEVSIAMDSGAVDHVANDEDMPGIEVVPSAASKAGRHFVGANGKTIENKGQAAVRMKAQDTGAMINSVFQIAQVSRPLYSVSKICDSGCEVAFDNKEGRVLKNGKVIASFPRRGGLYVSTFLIKPSDPSKHKQMGFQRHA